MKETVNSRHTYLERGDIAPLRVLSFNRKDSPNLRGGRQCTHGFNYQELGPDTGAFGEKWPIAKRRRLSTGGDLSHEQ